MKDIWWSYQCSLNVGLYCSRRDFRAIVYCPTCDGIALCDTCSKLPIKHSGVQWISDTSKIMMNRWKVSGVSAFNYLVIKVFILFHTISSILL